MNKVKVAVEMLEMDLASAIKSALGCSIRQFAEEEDLHESAVSAVLNGSTPHPYNKVRDALAVRLGLDSEEDRGWLEHALDAQRARTLAAEAS